MTKKDFEAIAKILAKHQEKAVDWVGRHKTAHYSILLMAEITNELADYFASKNKAFNRQKFLDAAMGSSQSDRPDD